MEDDKIIKVSLNKLLLSLVIGGGLGSCIGTAIGLLFGQAIYGDASNGLVWGIVIGTAVGAGSAYVFTLLKSSD
jgi:hypothetical protein